MIDPTAEGPSWMSPPPGWLYGTWSLTHTSQRAYLPLRNIQFDASPVFPQSTNTPGRLNDLLTFQIGDSLALHAVYGIDTPLRSIHRSFDSKWDYSFHLVGVGGSTGFNLTWAITAWGYDSSGIGYFLLYEHNPPNFDIFSKSDSGPSHETLESIHKAVRELGNEKLSQAVGHIVPTMQDGARRGEPPFQCDMACIDDKEGCRALGVC
ncbi:hypothetical protein NLI96_g10861 [Meripilus lineatus]|uniref:Uncharacterized protein n=1 Tax=Meripilus lineatus TaxID=2056292 RepID=A0AAD5UST7_9APHY|nr:hypothetical protein NLI96_g10861 [Physisporinus lineatus]